MNKTRLDIYSEYLGTDIQMAEKSLEELGMKQDEIMNMVMFLSSTESRLIKVITTLLANNIVVTKSGSRLCLYGKIEGKDQMTYVDPTFCDVDPDIDTTSFSCTLQSLSQEFGVAIQCSGIGTDYGNETDLNVNYVTLFMRYLITDTRPKPGTTESSRVDIIITTVSLILKTDPSLWKNILYLMDEDIVPIIKLNKLFFIGIAKMANLGDNYRIIYPVLNTELNNSMRVILTAYHSDKLALDGVSMVKNKDRI